MLDPGHERNPWLMNFGRWLDNEEPVTLFDPSFTDITNQYGKPVTPSGYQQFFLRNMTNEGPNQQRDMTRLWLLVHMLQQQQKNGNPLPLFSNPEQTIAMGEVISNQIAPKLMLPGSQISVPTQISEPFMNLPFQAIAAVQDNLRRQQTNPAMPLPGIMGTKPVQNVSKGVIDWLRAIPQNINESRLNTFQTNPKMDWNHYY
jgi:hypothetical protein